MRCVFISAMSGYPWGGSEELWSQAALRLHKAGHQVSASVAHWPDMPSKLAALQNAGIKLFPRKPLPNSLSDRILRRVKRRFFQETPKEHQWLLDQKPELLVISQGGITDGIEWMEFCVARSLPFAVIIQCNTEGWWPDDQRAEKLAALYQSAKVVFCVSRANLTLLERQLGRPLPNASVVWNPCNVSPDQVVAWPKDNVVWKIACVARLDPGAKGQDLLFEVMAKETWQNRPVEINLFGSGPCSRNLHRLVENFQLKNVRFKGHVGDIKEVWSENHLLVLPSRSEGLPLALVEAMWCARPAVVTDIGGNMEVCLDGETGFVATAPTVRSLGEALERAWQRRQEWQEIGKAGRALAEKLIPKDPVGDFCQKLTGC